MYTGHVEPDFVLQNHRCLQAMLTLSKIIKKDFDFFSGYQTFHEIKMF